MKQELVRLDRIASAMNGWLLAIAIGLGMLDLTVLVAKCLPVPPPTRRPINRHPRLLAHHPRRRGADCERSRYANSRRGDRHRRWWRHL
jgi:hypothetical protein